mmetsp:Transcript_22129/g.66461  ORF Transcript_22129/g.66461 Transcript_22129/m.66461 type:complete len:224 (+) Transcript_22129:327-998(+)
MDLDGGGPAEDREAEETFRLWRVRRTLMQMCRDRGYDVPDAECTMSLEEFGARFGFGAGAGDVSGASRGDLNTTLEHPETNDVLALFFPESKKVGIADVRTILENVKDEDVDGAIMVVRAGMTPTAKKSINEAQSSICKIEAFDEAELIVNITEHKLVPRHVLLTADGKRELLDRYKLKEHQLPRIKVSDPVARYYGLSRGQVVKIIRPSPTAGRYVTYRLVH